MPFLLLALVFVLLAEIHREIDPLNVGHRRGVRVTGSEFDDATVSALAICAGAGDILEEFAHCFLLAKEAGSLAPSVQITPLPEGNESLRHGTKSFRFRQGGTNSPLANQGTGQAGKESLSLGGVPLQFAGFFAMPHGKILE
jgi:hypothetical protein